MAKFYIHKTHACYVTEVIEVQAKNEDAALEKYYNEGGAYLGLEVGDSIGWVGDPTAEVFEAAPHNLPINFLPAKEGT